MSWLHKYKSAVDVFGLPKAILYLVNRALNPIGAAIHIYHFVAQPVSDGPMLPASRGKSIAVRQVETSDPVLLQMPLDQRVIAYRSSQHATCLGAFKGEKMIGCMWFCLGPYQEDEVRCRFQPLPAGQASWDFDFYLVPDQRLGFAFARLWDEANNYLYARGVRWSMSRISTLNLASLAAHGRLGTQSVGKALFIRLGGLQLALSSIRPHFHLSMGPRSFPDYTVISPATP